MERNTEIIDALKKVIEDEGSAKVGWAIRHIYGKDHRADEHEIHKISALIIKSGEFERIPVEKDFYIYRNPNYNLNQSLIQTNSSIQLLNDNILPENFQSQEKYGNRSLILAGLSVIFIAVTAFLQWKATSNKDLQMIKEEIKNNKSILDSINSSIKYLNLNLNKLNKDTVTVKIKSN